MRKLVLLTLTLLFLLVFTSVAFAGGWFTIGATHDPDAGLWASESGGDDAKVPHLGLQTSTNNCKTCHAVHDGNANGFKLLQDTSRATECDFCHGVSGALTDPTKKPYSPMESGGVEIPAKGEHTIGATDIPEASAGVKAANSIATDGLSCGNCHSVHDAWTLSGALIAGTEFEDKLLRRDPANNGSDVMRGMNGVIAYDATHKPILDGKPDASTSNEVMSAFCGDCHNKNPNWDTGALNPGGDETPNAYAHRMGLVDGIVDIYGQRKAVSSTTTATCMSCHLSFGTPPSKFPHQSVGHKLLANTYTDTSTYLDGGGSGGYTGDPYRPLPNLDTRVCRACHSEIGKQTAASF